jgi:hypothetical protein
MCVGCGRILCVMGRVPRAISGEWAIGGVYGFAPRCLHKCRASGLVFGSSPPLGPKIQNPRLMWAAMCALCGSAYINSGGWVFDRPLRGRGPATASQAASRRRLMSRRRALWRRRFSRRRRGLVAVFDGARGMGGARKRSRSQIGTGPPHSPTPAHACMRRGLARIVESSCRVDLVF